MALTRSPVRSRSGPPASADGWRGRLRLGKPAIQRRLSRRSRGAAKADRSYLKYLPSLSFTTVAEISIRTPTNSDATRFIGRSAAAANLRVPARASKAVRVRFEESRNCSSLLRGLNERRRRAAYLAQHRSWLTYKQTPALGRSCRRGVQQ